MKGGPRQRAAVVLFVLSGAAGLIYEVVWVRSLSLVFGGSHLAVATVLSLFMGGLALGGFRLGRRADRVARPLRMYGILELGIAASALGVMLLLRFYPVVFPPLARLAESNAAWLTLLRVAFASIALIVPTTLMGGTLPVMTRALSDGEPRTGRRLAILYGANTLGAVAGTLGAAFLLLPSLGVLRTTVCAVALNAMIGLVALLLPEPSRTAEARAEGQGGAEAQAARDLASRVVLAGIGASGFCALGYEVLWTRTLGLVVGTSVYGFAVMLAAFLFGIALGSHALPLLPRSASDARRGALGPVVTFGLVQIAVGASALLTTHGLRRLPVHSIRLQGFLLDPLGEFAARQAAGFILAFGWMAVPAFFLGLSFPVACAVESGSGAGTGRAVGRVQAANTVGGILGAAVSGFVLLPVLGIERSLQSLVVVGLAFGVAAFGVALVGRRGRVAVVGLTATAAVALLGLIVLPGRLSTWNRELFAVFRNNQSDAFDSPDRVREALEQTEVLYYHEGKDETISVIRPRGGEQGLLVNGRVEGAKRAEDVQCQRTLGHLPMLLHPAPRRVFVLGLGTGMTLGATSIHPTVEEITLAEIERGVLPAARAFGDYNHHVLDDPRLRIVHDDGRNFLRTTRESFDVITADPIHPWSGGAAYLYTVEHFRTAAARLAEGGVLCQWLPIYELDPEDLRSIVRTFSESFRHTVIWLTYYDAELVGSNAPIVLDEAAIAARMSDPAVAADLAVVDMGTARDFLSYFVMGDAGVRAFSRTGVIHTDDNLWLEFQAPRSRGKRELPGANVMALAEFRDPPPIDGAAQAAPLYDRAHALGLWNRWDDPEFRALLSTLRQDYSDYAPGRFLESRYEEVERRQPRPVGSERIAVRGADGTLTTVDLTAVTFHIGPERGIVVLVDNAARDVWIERYVDAPVDEIDSRLQTLALRLLDGVRAEKSTSGGAADRAELVRKLERVAEGRGPGG